MNSRMTLRRLALLVGAVLCLSSAAALPAGAAEQPPAATTERESFEWGFGAWRPDTDGLARDWRIVHSSVRAVDGRYSLEYSLDGRNDDGTIWIERTFLVPGRRTVTVDVSFWLFSPAQSITAWPVVGVAGGRDPEVERDLPIIGYADRAPGWARYSFRTKVTPGPDGVIWVAAGISVTWEVVRTYHVDLVETVIAST